MADFAAAIPIICGICKKAIKPDLREGMAWETWYGSEMAHEKCGRKAMAYDRHDRKRAFDGIKRNKLNEAG